MNETATPAFECVPNISEGRQQTIVEDLAHVLASSGCRVLDVHSDVDHNRTVFTAVGSSGELAQGAIALARRAVQRIDLRQHRGVHPRMGAVDVIPFVPLGSSGMEACVALARSVGETIGESLELPVYFYGEAAISPSRRRLSPIRNEGVERLSSRMGQEGWAPDCGPARLHPTAGAVAVGARGFLVAYNVHLDTQNTAIGRRIAAAIRETGGGLPGLQALGLYLASRRLVQVSMNLTDIWSTSLPQVFERVQFEAQRHGVRVVDSEIVGLAPRVAFQGANATDLMLGRDLNAVVLEERMGRL